MNRQFISPILILAVAMLAFPGRVEIRAASATTSVTVGNDAPTFNSTHEPHESPASTGASPTNMGANVTFKATATDANGDGWYLAVCKTGSITAHNGSAPTCDTDETWAISTVTTSNTEATVTYQITSSETAQYYAWFAYACDNNSGGAACSSVSNGGVTGGDGTDGTPFYVNHAPSVSSSSNNGPKNPGATLTFTVAKANYSDGDTNTAQDTVKLFVCSTQSFSGGASPACSSTELCHSSSYGTPGTDDLTCTYNLDNPKAAGDVHYYPYIVDNHGLIGTGAGYGEDKTYTVNNVAPGVSTTPSFDIQTAGLTLTGEKTTTSIDVTGVLTDDNGCGDLTAANIFVNAWLTSLGGSNCTGNTNYNKCYYHAPCVYDATVDSCGSSDKTAGYRCTIPFQYYADPTDTGTPWAGDTWTATLIPGDSVGTRGTTSDTPSPKTMNSFLDLTLASGKDSIAYGSISAGSKIDPLVDKIHVEASGNDSLDVNLSGTAMTHSSDSIAVGNQRYTVNGSDLIWDDATALTSGAVLAELNCAKSGYSGLATKSIYWGISIPAGQAAVAYTGSNTITAVKNNSATLSDWGAPN